MPSINQPVAAKRPRPAQQATTAQKIKLACQYVGAGYPVLLVAGLRNGVCACPDGAACTNKHGKHPLTSAAKHGYKSATLDVSKVTTLIRKYPDCNLGVATRPGRYYFVDLDPRKGGDKKWIEIFGKSQPNTPTQQSGSGDGRHMIYSGTPPDWLKGIDGIDVIENGYIVAAPSIHVSGNQYCWKDRYPVDSQRGNLPKPIKLPVKVANRAASAPSAPSDHAYIPLDEMRRLLSHISADITRKKWVGIGHALKAYYADDPIVEDFEVEELWEEWSKSATGEHHWLDADKEVWATLNKNQGTDRPLMTVGSLVMLATENKYRPPENWGPLPTKPAMAKAKKEGASSMVIQRLSDIAKKELPDIKIFVPNLLPAGLTILYGRAKMGKSWLMLDLAGALANGADFWGQPTIKSKVLYLALEDNERRMQNRMNKLRMGNAPVDVTFGAPRADEDLDLKLAALIKERGYDVVIIDTLAAIAPGGPTSKNVWQNDYELVNKLRVVANDHNAAIIVVTHAKKNSDKGEAADAGVGTSGLLAGVDAYWVFQKIRGGDIQLTVQGRDIEGDEYAVRFDKETARWQMIGQVAHVVGSFAQNTILSALEQNDKPMRWSELKKASGLGASFDAPMSRLVERGTLEQTATGAYRQTEIGEEF